KAPQRPGGVAEAEVDPAPAPLARRCCPPTVRQALLELRVHQALTRLEGAFVLLADPRLAELAAFVLNEGRRQPRALVPRHAEAGPGHVRVVPLAPEETALAERRAQADRAAAGHAGHRRQRREQRVRHARRLVEDQQADA